MPSKRIKQYIPEYESVQAESRDEFNCPTSGHSVHLPTGTQLTGNYRIYDSKGKELGRGLVENLVAAETANGTTDSEDK